MDSALLGCAGVRYDGSRKRGAWTRCDWERGVDGRATRHNGLLGRTIDSQK